MDTLDHGYRNKEHEMTTDWLIHKKINVDGFKDIIDRVVVNNNVPQAIGDYSTLGSYSRQYNLDDYTDQFMMIQSAVINNIDEEKQFKFNLKKSWTVYGEEYSYHSIHRHGPHTNRIATVLYLDVPEKPTKHQPSTFFYMYRDESGEIRTGDIQPEKGSLIVMPVYLYHGAYPQAKGTRQTLNMDFEIEI